MLVLLYNVSGIFINLLPNFGDLCSALLPIFGERMGGEDLGKLLCLEYWPQCNIPGGDDGDDVVGDGGGRILLGDSGGVLDSLGDGTRGGRFLGCCRGTLGPGPELSEGVGGSPLLQAIEQ